MSFLKSIRSLFIVEVDSNESEEQPIVQDNSSPEMEESSKGDKGRVVVKFTEVLLRSLEDHNQDGFDYLRSHGRAALRLCSYSAFSRGFLF